jgi:hypothetical protein
LRRAVARDKHSEIGARDPERRGDLGLTVDDDVERANWRGGKQVRQRLIRLAQSLELGE